MFCDITETPRRIDIPLITPVPVVVKALYRKPTGRSLIPIRSRVCGMFSFRVAILDHMSQTRTASKLNKEVAH